MIQDLSISHYISQILIIILSFFSFIHSLFSFSTIDFIIIFIDL